MSKEKPNPIKLPRLASFSLIDSQRLFPNWNALNKSMADSATSLIEAGEEKQRLEQESHDAQLSSAESLEVMQRLLIESERQNRANFRMQGAILALSVGALIVAFVGWLI